MSLTSNQESAILRAINNLKVAIQSLVTSTAQFADDSQTVTGTTMTLSNKPAFVVGVFYNGQRLTNTVDYNISGTTVTFTFTLNADAVSVVYKY